MSKKKTVWLVWEIQIVIIETAKVQLQSLRVIADTKDKAAIYKAIFEREKKWKFNKDELWFNVEEREVNHMLGIEDLSGYVSRNRV